MRLRAVFSTEIIVGAVIGVVCARLLVGNGTVTDRVGVAGDFLELSGALLGIVFAALALVVALISQEYLRHLDENTDGGVLAFLSPFMIAIGIQVAVFMGAIGYRAFAADLPEKWEHWVFSGVTVLFAVAALDVVALARNVLLHGLARARLLKVTDLQQASERKRGQG
jgi:small-conductance mechanosensitive channel